VEKIRGSTSTASSAWQVGHHSVVEVTSGPMVEVSSECVICLDNPPTWIYEGCKHLCACKKCAKKQKDQANDGKKSKKTPLVACPLCRQVTKVVPYSTVPQVSAYSVYKS
jgi:hypothetical protein